MKHCTKCDTTKSLEEFGRNANRKDGRQVYCKVCTKVINAEYYKKSPEQNEKRRAWKVQQVELLQARIKEYLESHPCVDCGEPDWVVLEFDHVIGIKCYNISDIVRLALPVEILEQEIVKCEVRCANDHRRVTAQRGNHWRSR